MASSLPPGELEIEQVEWCNLAERVFWILALSSIAFVDSYAIMTGAQGMRL